MNTSALESRIAAFKLLHMIAESMGTAFAAYAEQVLPIMTANMDYFYSKAVRKYAMKTLNSTLTALGEPRNVQVFTGLFDKFTAMLTKSLEREDLREIKIVLKHLWLMVKNLNETNKSNKNYMSEANFNTLFPLLNRVLTLVSNAKKETLKSFKNQNIDFDEEDEETFKETLAKISSPSTYVMEISGQLVLNFGDQLTALVKSHLLNFFAMNLHAYQQLSESELLDATCFFCDFVEYALKTADTNMVQELNSKFLEIFDNT